MSFEEVSDGKDLVEDNDSTDDEEGRRINIEENDSTDGEEGRRITISSKVSVVSSVFGNKNDDADADLRFKAADPSVSKQIMNDIRTLQNSAVDRESFLFLFTLLEKKVTSPGYG